MGAFLMFKQFKRYSPSGSQYVWRRKGEAYLPECITPTVKHGGGSIMIWGCMTSQGVGEVCVCEGRTNNAKYINMLEEVLEPSVIKFYSTVEDDFFFNTTTPLATRPVKLSRGLRIKEYNSAVPRSVAHRESVAHFKRKSTETRNDIEASAKTKNF